MPPENLPQPSPPPQPAPPENSPSEVASTIQRARAEKAAKMQVEGQPARRAHRATGSPRGRPAGKAAPIVDGRTGQVVPISEPVIVSTVDQLEPFYTFLATHLSKISAKHFVPEALESCSFTDDEGKVIGHSAAQVHIAHFPAVQGKWAVTYMALAAISGVVALKMMAYREAIERRREARQAERARADQQEKAPEVSASGALSELNGFGHADVAS